MPMHDIRQLLEDEMHLGEAQNSPLVLVIGFFVLLGGSSGGVSLKIFEGSTCGP